MALLNSLKKLGVTRYEVKAPVSSPLRFAFVSDLHDCESAPVLERIRALEPDAILIPGDLVHDSRHFEKGLAFLPQAAKLAPTFLSLGNHEMKGPRNYLPQMRESGAVLLDNAWREFRGLLIGGWTTGFAKGQEQSKLQKTPVPDLSFPAKFAGERGYKILLCHHPEYFPRYLKNTPIDLVLAGHAHGGQWRFFGRGVFAPGQGLFPALTAGLHQGRLLVSRGVGNPIYVPRIFNPPEVILLTLTPQ